MYRAESRGSALLKTVRYETDHQSLVGGLNPVGGGHSVIKVFAVCGKFRQEPELDLSAVEY